MRVVRSGQGVHVHVADIEDARFCTPVLTTIAPDKRRVAELALGLLETRISHGSLGTGHPSEPRSELADYSLLIRESTVGPPPR